MVQDVDHGGGCGHVGIGDILEISVRSSQLCCEPKPTLKIYSLKENKLIFSQN